MEKREKIHFVTGRLAERALRNEVEKLSETVGFEATVQVLPISVAALMTPNWIARHIQIPAGTDRVIVPGYCQSTDELSKLSNAVVETGPKDLRRLREHFGLKQQRPDNYGAYDIEIIAEINHAPRLSVDELVDSAEKLCREGADVIDIGCIPGECWLEIGESIRAIRERGIRVSVDSLNPREIAAAADAGAELVLSVNSTNRDFAKDWGIEVVVIPDRFEGSIGLVETMEILDKQGVLYRVDPILEPIGCGFAHSLSRYIDFRSQYPNVSMMMGIGNLSELSDCDSAGMNLALLGICQELKIGSVLTTQVINWCRSSVRECDLARRLVYYAVQQGVPPKHLEPLLVMLRDPDVPETGADYLGDLASNVKDHNFRIFSADQKIHAIGGRKHFQDPDPFVVFDQLCEAGFSNLDASHSFYLGFEMCKAMIAGQLGKEYVQDQALNWGFLTRPEEDRHRLRKKNSSRNP